MKLEVVMFELVALGLVRLKLIVSVVVEFSALRLILCSALAGHSTTKATDKTAKGQIILFLANFIPLLGNHCHSCGFLQESPFHCRH